MQESWSSNQPPPVFQKSPPPYQDTRYYQPRTQQPYFSPQLYTQNQTKHSPGQQEVVSYCNVPQAIWSNTNTCVPFQRNQCDGPINQSFPQQPFTGHPQPNGSSNGSVYHGQVNTQSCSYICTRQNYRNTGPVNTDVGPEQALKFWTPISDHGRSRPMAVANDNTRGWSYHVSDNGRFCSIANQQQPPAPRPANLHHQHHQHSGQQQTPGQLLFCQGQSGTSVCYAYHNSVTLPPAGPEKNNLPLMNFQQSQTELNSTQSLSDPNSASHTNSNTYNINQSSQDQFNPTSRPDLNLKRYINTKLHQLFCSNDTRQGFYNGLATKTQSSDNGTVCNSGSKYVFSELNLQSVAEPPSERINHGETQRDYFNKLPTINTNMSKENNGLMSRSALTGTHQEGRMEQSHTEKRQSRTGQSEIIYSTDPADCLEAVFALQKSLQQVNKAVAIVPPISQQTSNTEEMHNVGPQVVDSPPLKISAVWSLAEVCDSQNPFAKVNDKLTYNPLPTVGEDDKIRTENETLNNMAGACMTQRTEMSSASPTAGCQNNMLKRNCDLSDAVFELSNVPVVGYTLEELMNLVKSLEMTDSSAGYTEKPESVSDRILELYWNGNKENLMKHIKALNKVRRYSVVESVKNDKSVVFESITPENLKKVSNCAVVNNRMYSLSEEFRSSWLNVDGQPADIAKVLLEPLSDDITLPRDVSQIVRNFTQVTEITSPSAEEHVKPEEGPEDVCTSSEENAENGEEETDTQNKDSDADIPEVTLLCHAPNQQETSQKQDDIRQHQKSLNTKPTDLSPVADVCSGELNFCITTQEVLKSDGFSDGAKSCNGSFSKEPHSNFIDTMQLEDISDDESNDSLVMGITVLSSEDAQKIFQQFEKEPQRNIKIASPRSDVKPPELVSHLNLPSQPNPEQNKAKICSRCGTNSTVKFNSTYVTHNDRLFCSTCWDTAPSLTVEMKCCSSKRNETHVLHSLTNAKELGQDQSPPSLKPEFPKTFPASAVAHNADEGPAEKPEGESMLKSVLIKTSDIESTVELELTKDENSEKTSVSTPQLLTQCHKACISKSGEGQKCSLVRNTIKSRQEREDPSSETDRTFQKSPETVREETSECSAAVVTLEMGEENCPVKKMKTNQTRRVSFALYGSNFKHQRDEQGQNFSPPASLIVSNAGRDSWKKLCFLQTQRFSAPATLTLSTACKDISSMTSARKKVHDRWRSTFISTTQRTSPSKSPQKKKMQKPHEVLKSNMVALKEHLKHRAMILSDQETQKH